MVDGFFLLRYGPTSYTDRRFLEKPGKEKPEKGAAACYCVIETRGQRFYYRLSGPVHRRYLLNSSSRLVEWSFDLILLVIFSVWS